MKHPIILLFILTLLSIATPSLGQMDSSGNKKLVFGYSIGTNVSQATYGLNLFAYVTVEKGKSLFAIGPVLGQKMEIVRWGLRRPFANKGYTINGFHVMYQISPNPEGKRFDLFFHYEFDFLYFQDMGYDYTDHAINGAYNSHISSIENYVGYGLKIKISKNLYLNHSIGIGYLYANSWINEINFDGYSGLSLNTKLALNYRFRR
ncbi:MAG: hypothetical protein WC760_09765 [Bacteroidia bacterium]|jgi:hypothetical protein